MKHETSILTGLDAAIMNAEIKVPRRPNGKIINMYPIIKFGDASKEMQEDKKMKWIIDDTHFGKNRTFIFRKHTEEEKEEMRLNEIYKLEQMFDFILKHYGWQYAKEFYKCEHWRKKFDKYNIIPNLNIPHCQYEKNHQCDIECPFFKGYCAYEEEE